MNKVISATAIAILALGTTAALAGENAAYQSHKKVQALWAKNDKTVSAPQVSVTDESTGSRNFGIVTSDDSDLSGKYRSVFERLQSVQPDRTGR